MNLPWFFENLAKTLTTDAKLKAWAFNHFGEAFTTIYSNRPVSQIHSSELPAFIFEMGDGDSDIEVAGINQFFETTMDFVIVWNEANQEKAFNQRAELPELVTLALMNNATLSGSCNGVWLSSYESDRSANHPRHFMQIKITAQFNVVKT